MVINKNNDYVIFYKNSSFLVLKLVNDSQKNDKKM